MSRFEKYLDRKHKFITDMIDILKKSKSSTIQAEIEILEGQLEILDDIIHHFGILVKGVEND